MAKYTLWNITEAGVGNVHATFNNKEDLIRFLAYGTNTHHNENRTRWTNRYIDEQNITGKDIMASHYWEMARDENGEVRIAWGMPVYDYKHTVKIRPWHLEDEYGRTVDMVMFKEEVYDIVAGMSYYVRNTLSMRKPPRGKRKERQGRAYHHCCHFRCTSDNHRYGRTLKTFEESAEDVEELLTAHQMQILKVKPKDMYAEFCWGDDFFRSGPSGWKEHKNSRQWEAKQKRVDSVWVSGESKYDSVADDEYDPMDGIFAHEDDEISGYEVFASV